MVNFVSDTLYFWTIVFFVVAAIGAVTAAAVVADFVVGNHRARLARRESVRTYYRGLVPSH